MKLAIVGTTKDLDNEELFNAVNIITDELKEKPELVVSGGAKGIDSLAALRARLDNIPTKIFKPEGYRWADYAKRNMQIVEECDKLICITTKTKDKKCYHCNEDHQKTAGCWTMKKAKEMGKPTRLYVV